MISKYLKALTDSNNRIIVPDFGAFMIQDTPEGKQITFNDFLKFNDGLLVNQIIKTEKVSKTEATDLIKEFISAVEKEFSKNNPYQLAGMGILTKDNHGTIKFESKADTKEQPKAETKEKPKAEVKEIPKTSPTDVKPTIVLDEKPKTEETKKETKSEPVKEVKIPATPDKEIIKSEPAPVSAQKVEAKKPEPVSKPVSATIPPNKPITSVKKPMPTSTPKSNNAKNIIIIVAAIVIVLGGATWAFFKFDLGSLFGKKEQPPVEVVQTPPPVADTVKEDTVVPEPVVVEETPVEKPAENVKKYYLIAGSFKVPSNATNFQQKLTEKGYESEIIMRNNGFNCVSYKTYYSWGEVLSAWKDMRNSDPQTWILIR